MIVVTGATGNVGQQLVTRLAAAGERVTGLARRLPETDAQPAGQPGRVTYEAADLADPDTLHPVLDGADAFFLLAVGHEPARVVDAAKRAGVRRLVLLSSQGAGTRPETYGHPRTFEDAVRESGLEHTILRPGGFASNALAWAESVRTGRTVAAPFGDTALPVVDPADLAEAAATVLRATDGAYDGRIHTLTGPEAITPRERVRALGDALGVELSFVEQSHAQAREQMAAFLPLEVVDRTLGILGSPLPEEQRVSPDLAELLGRPPATFGQWARRHVAAFS